MQYRDQQLIAFEEQGIRQNIIHPVSSLFDSCDDIEAVDEPRVEAKVQLERQAGHRFELLKTKVKNLVAENKLADMIEYEAENKGHYS